MTPIPIDGPAVEPVAVPDLRAWLRRDDAAEDATIASLIRAARLQLEAESRRVLIESRWRIHLDRWPPGRTLALPLSPVLAVEEVAVTEEGGGTQALAPALYRLVPGDPPRLTIAAAAPQPATFEGGIAITLRAGYGATPADVPEPLRQALRLLVARAFEERGDGEGGAGLPRDVIALIAPFRAMRL